MMQNLNIPLELVFAMWAEFASIMGIETVIIVMCTDLNIPLELVCPMWDVFTSIIGIDIVNIVLNTSLHFCVLIAK